MKIFFYDNQIDTSIMRNIGTHKHEIIINNTYYECMGEGEYKDMEKARECLIAISNNIYNENN